MLGSNTYLVDCGTGPKHVSGDCISRVAATAGRSIGGAHVDREDLEAVNIADEDDNVSIVSDSSLGSAIFDNVAPQPDNARVRRVRRIQVEQLGSPVANLPCLRPRNR